MIIKVTGELDTDEMDPSYVDLTHETGLSTKGYEAYYGGEPIAGLDDLDFKLSRTS